MKHHPQDVSSSHGLTSYFHRTQVVACKVIYNVLGLLNYGILSCLLTCHSLSSRSLGGCWYLSADRRGKTVPSHHQAGYPAYRGLCQPICDCEDPATLLTLSKVLDNDPRSDSQCRHDVPINQTAHRNFGWKCFVCYLSDFTHGVHRCKNYWTGASFIAFATYNDEDGQQTYVR